MTSSVPRDFLTGSDFGLNFQFILQEARQKLGVPLARGRPLPRAYLLRLWGGLKQVFGDLKASFLAMPLGA